MGKAGGFQAYPNYRRHHAMKNNVSVMMISASNKTPEYQHAAKNAITGGPNIRNRLGHVSRPGGGSSKYGEPGISILLNGLNDDFNQCVCGKCVNGERSTGGFDGNAFKPSAIDFIHWCVEIHGLEEDLNKHEVVL